MTLGLVDYAIGGYGFVQMGEDHRKKWAKKFFTAPCAV